MKLGVCYYPEHWPREGWASDAARMRELGLGYVRIGEFAWSRVEPAPGRFEWGWLDEAIDTLGRAGLEVVLGTPTATPPKWLVDRHPEILATGADGRPRGFGSRRHYCFASPVYREQCRRIVEAMAQRYGKHPAVAAWQTDNEYGCHDTVLSYSEAAAAGFRRWLERRYGTVEALNEAWGTVFWSQEYRGFDEVDPPAGTVTEANPAHRLDYQRFASDQVVEFNRVQTEILRRLSPGRDLVHNYMGFFTAFDHHAVAADLDVASWDSYPLGFLDQGPFPEEDKAAWLRTGHPDVAAFHHDLYRGVGRGRWWVMEQQPGPVNWAPHNPAPLPGMVRLWTWEAFAHGAEVVSYFRWRQAPFAQEQMHAGLNLPDGRPDQGYAEAAQVAEELARGDSAPVARAPVALILDYQARWVTEIQPQGASFDGLRLAFEWYNALRRLGLDVDILPPSAELDGYRAVVIPCLPIVAEDLVRRLQAFRGELLVGPRSGSKTPSFQIPPELPPGPLQALLPLKVTRVESLRPGVEQLLRHRRHLAMLHWREHVETDLERGAEYVDGGGAWYRHGRCRYVAGWPDPALCHLLMVELCREAGIPVQDLKPGLRLRRRGSVQYAFNYGPEAVRVPVPEGAELLLGQAQLEAGELAAWRVRTPSDDSAENER